MKHILLVTIISLSCFFNAFAKFGKTHFIVGYQASCKVSDAKIVEKPATSSLSKKLKNQQNGACLIDANRTTQSFFTTVHDLSDIILSLIAEAQTSLYIAAFTLTDIRIANLIIEKHKKGLDVCVIVDPGNMKQMYSKGQMLLDNGVCVLAYNPELNPLRKKNQQYDSLMHHKCIVIDNKIVVTGSANLTRSGQKNNIENINILRDKQTVDEHCQEIQRLRKKYCTQCKSRAL